MHDSRPNSAKSRRGKTEINDIHALAKDRMDGALKISHTPPVNYPHFKNPSKTALIQILAYKIADFRRTELVKIQHAVNRDRNWRQIVVHRIHQIRCSATPHQKSFKFGNPPRLLRIFNL
jgi:hypothetical protein